VSPRDLLYLLILPCLAAPFYFLESGLPPADVVARSLVILFGFAVIDRLISGGHPYASPLRVSALMAAVLMFLGLGAYTLSFLGTAGVLAVVTLLSAVTLLSTILKRPNLRDARAAAGLCTTCGYDLRASQDRCPECNTRIPEYLARKRRTAAELRALKGKLNPE
jgi:hypothetical protein